MSVQSEIDRINANIASAYTAVDEMGGTLPAAQNSANLAGAVSSIPVGVTEERLEEALAAKQDAITGQPGQVVGFDATGAAAAVRGWSNPNLLPNWDFRHPVNRNGLQTYTSTGLTIDLWYNAANPLNVSLGANGVTINKIDSYGIFQQRFNIPRDFLGKKVTMSCIYNSNQLAYSTATFPSSVGTSYESPRASIPGGYMNLYLDASGLLTPRFVISGGLVSIQAVKLEFGTQQTLAYQDADGNLVLSDPPNYNLQYAMCSLYSPITGEWVGSQHSNQNLLGNWYLADPVNQRGLSQYTGSGFGIDLWQSTGNMTVSLEDGWVKVYNPDSVMRYYVHPCELSLLENLHGQRVTQSMLYRCNSYGCYLYTGYSTRFGFYTMTSVYLKSTNAADVAESSFVDYFNANAQRFCVCSIGISPNATVYIKAVKLELGAEQTLARKEGDTWVLNDPPPDKALELAKCQRYYEVVKNVGPLISGTQTGYWRYWVPFKAQKRSKPTVDIKSAAGTSGNISYNSGGAWVEFPIKSATPFTDGLILELKEAPVGVASIFNVIADSNM